MSRESMEFDVVVVGGGPSGLSAAIRLKQLAQAAGSDLSVCVLEKGAAVGGHILSGAILDPRAMNELLPDWAARGAPIKTPVTDEAFSILTETKQFDVPQWLLPNCFKNHGCYVVSLSDVVQWLGEQAEALGVEIYPGFAAADVLYSDDGRVLGVVTGDLGIGKDGSQTAHYQPGMELRAHYTLFAEGARGHLGKGLIDRFNLDKASDPQSYGIGLKEVWEVSADKAQPGFVMHSAGWPLPSDTYGGGFLYHLQNNLVSVGFVVGLNYANPWLSPFEEFQRYKTHPRIRSLLEGGRRITYGARAITAGGLNSLPDLIFPGGALIGCDAGFLNASRIKGSHAAMKSGMMAAEACFEALQSDTRPDLLAAYPKAFKNSWLYEELHKARNFKPAMKKGLWWGSLLVGIDQTLFGGRAPFTLHNRNPDYAYLEPASAHQPIVYPKPDGQVSFDRLSSVALTGTNHEENQPSHLRLRDTGAPIAINLTQFAGPEARYCPAGVYEYLNQKGEPITEFQEGALFQINAQNCIHCKTCDIKDPAQNINWVTPEGGGGPNYSGT